VRDIRQRCPVGSAAQQDKRDRAGSLPGTPPIFVPVDFGRDRLGEALAGAGHRAGLPTTWIWEGVDTAGALALPIRHRTSLGNGRVMAADRTTT
jgi:hypothetical protein